MTIRDLGRAAGHPDPEPGTCPECGCTCDAQDPPICYVGPLGGLHAQANVMVGRYTNDPGATTCPTCRAALADQTPE
jgi:hypothetical protein